MEKTVHVECDDGDGDGNENGGGENSTCSLNGLMCFIKSMFFTYAFIFRLFSSCLFFLIFGFSLAKQNQKKKNKPTNEKSYNNDPNFCRTIAYFHSNNIFCDLFSNISNKILLRKFRFSLMHSETQLKKIN